MTNQSNAAAERSAHVTRGVREVPAEWPVVQLPDGKWQLKVVAELQAENARLREALKAANWVIEWTGEDLLNGNPYSKVLARYQEYRRVALGEKG